MSMRPLTDIIPLVFVELPMCPDALIMQKAITVAHEFCEHTQVWTCELDPIKVRDGVQDYDLDQPSYARIDTIKKVELDEIELLPLHQYLMPSKCQIRLVHIPTEDTRADENGLEIEVVLVPWREAATSVLPADIWNSYHDAIEAGVKSILMAMPGKKWSDPRQAKDYALQYIQRKNAATIDQNRLGMNLDLTAVATAGHEFI
jgi:hypothetical protein